MNPESSAQALQKMSRGSLTWSRSSTTAPQLKPGSCSPGGKVGGFKKAEQPELSIREILKQKKLKAERLKNVLGTFADENDQLSEYIPSPRAKEVSDQEYLQTVAVQSSGKTGVQPKNQKSSQWSSVGKVNDVNFRSLHDAKEKHADQYDYEKPKTPAYFRRVHKPIIERRQEQISQSVIVKESGTHMRKDLSRD